MADDPVTDAESTGPPTGGLTGDPADAPHLLPFPPGGSDEGFDSEIGDSENGDSENGDSENGDSENGDDDTLSFGDGEDLETAYRRALAVVDAAEPTLAPDPRKPAEPKGDESPGDGGPADGGPAIAGAVPTPTVPPVRVRPREVVEAALFVGGAGLTAERAGKLLRGTFTDADLAGAVGELNRRYEAEGRPYRARSTDDGYVLKLLPEYESLRRRLYGLGPREVTLPPDVLETLSVVAYRQPITAADVDRTRDRPSGGALRRLVRLGVLRIDKPVENLTVAREAGDEEAPPPAKPEPTFSTTDRFLDLFGLGSLDDLPVPADLRFK
ncbi:SMC-Scp complex subunit ScpB [Alienimonas chondri]|uniref:Segregation and condensation protein B n=1 Tax=Alienimonas chondri TaxID=2681879 RepID=A0ABX1VAC5_9PLAN|nr:SMC-Scp complex subunit ScpB [Alienimonas chondri]NNJ24832.1 Segregation and condensation protein B [Alienimonas chondri]